MTHRRPRYPRATWQPLVSDKGWPGIETRFVIGLLLLKHIYGLSDEGVCERWVYDPYFQQFTGETFFRHAFPHERFGLSHWREGQAFARRDQGAQSSGR